MHLKINKLSNICFILLFAFVFLFHIVLMIYINKYKCFWGDDYFFCRYFLGEKLYTSLSFEYGHGGGYIGLFLSKFLSFGLPSMLNLHPNDYLSYFVGIFEGIFTALLPILILDFSIIYKKSKCLYLLFYLLISASIIHFMIGSNTFFITYNWFRYIFSFVFFSIFWNYIYKILLTKDIEIKKISIILATICGYIIGTSSEILFFLSAFMTVCIVLLKICKFPMNRLDIKFYLPVCSLYIAIICFISSWGFKQVAIDRGMQNINLSWHVIKEFTQTYFQFYVVDCIWLWVVLIFLVTSTLIISIKKKIDTKKIIFPLIMIIGIMLVIYSLVLCGKTYNETTRDRFWLYHSNIQCMFKILLLYPIIIYCNLIIKTIKNKYIPIALIVIINFFILFNLKKEIDNFDMDFLSNIKKVQYQYNKIIRFYNLKEQTAKIPKSMVYSSGFWELDEENTKGIEISSMDKIYHDNKTSTYDFIVTDDNLQDLYKDGIKFSNEELEELKFSRLKDNDFVLGIK